METAAVILFVVGAVIAFDGMAEGTGKNFWPGFLMMLPAGIMDGMGIL